MKKALPTAVATIAVCAQAPALDIEAVRAKPTADNPQYENKEVWPTLVGDEYGGPPEELSAVFRVQSEKEFS